MASGHINPSLPVARALVRQGHEVHFQCREQMRDAIEGTGATFYDEVKNQPEMFDGREPDILGATESLKREFGLENDNMMLAGRKLYNVMLELAFPGTLRFLQHVKPDVVVCCPILNREAVFAAKFLGVPSVALLTTAGPRSLAKLFQELLDMCCTTAEEILQAAMDFAPGKDSRARLEAVYGLEVRDNDTFEPLGVMDSIINSSLTVVTTCEDLQDALTPEMDEAYSKAGTVFEAVGPLLDVQGAVRAAGHKFQGHETQGLHDAEGEKNNEDDPLSRLQAARDAGRKVILVSMGTVVTGDSSDWGWHAKPRGAGGERVGLTGRQLCQSAWAGAFDAFGAYGEKADQAPLVLVSLGPQPDALESMQIPDNALCMPVLPQVDLLKAGVDLFLTHGGQNSFTESLSAGVPVVVCPGFGDQQVNARKAVDLGVGLQVERPTPAAGEEDMAVSTYRRAVSRALLEVDAETRFTAAASSCSERLHAAGGVPRTVELILRLTGMEAAPSALPTLLTRQSVKPAVELGKVAADATASHVTKV
eukprot:TRINITY_DN3304_c0_g1_i1.p1 TRINITY_DN3304_c0_g1~~TRINITY_DN3304_c0_g1_i1.p1  ORF type:complete len:573 (-),score=114.11 TRINITY_DN3304_c0_g1_i1:177-1781(-)